MATYTPINVDLHKISHIEIHTGNHNSGDQNDPKDDFFVTQIRIFREDGTHALSVHSFSHTCEPVSVEIKPALEYRNRMLKPGEQAPEEVWD